jgi:hypothetical protein
MKKVFLTALVAALGIATASAQFEWGTKTLDVKTSGLNLDFLSGEGKQHAKFDLALEGSYFIIDRLAIVVDLGAEAEQKDDEDEESSWLVGAGARYYISPGGFFAGGRLSVKGDTEEVRLVSGIMEGGYTWYVREDFYIEPTLRISKDYDIDVKRLSGQIRLQVMVGFGLMF